MNKREIVQVLLDGVQRGEFKHVADMLSDDFQFSGPVPTPINAPAWLDMSSSMRAAFPDLNYHFRVIGTEGNVVRGSMQMSGTHHAPFDLSAVNMGLIPATHKTFSAALQKIRITVAGAKISSWVVESTDRGDLSAMLGQLGLKLAAS
jgi:predicted ester cyclase